MNCISQLFKVPFTYALVEFSTPTTIVRNFNLGTSYAQNALNIQADIASFIQSGGGTRLGNTLDRVRIDIFPNRDVSLQTKVRFELRKCQYFILVYVDTVSKRVTSASNLVLA